MKFLLFHVLLRMFAPASAVPSQRSQHALVRREAQRSENASEDLEESGGDRRRGANRYGGYVNSLEWKRHPHRVREFFHHPQSVSFPAQPLVVPGQHGGFAYVTMCIVGQLGARDFATEVMECLGSICSLRKSTPSSEGKTVVMVNKEGVNALKQPLKEFGAEIVELPPLHWADQKKYPEPKRAYSFYKLHAWRLVGYERLFWFDQDVFFLRDAKVILDKYQGPGFAAARFPLNGGYCFSKIYINSGVMLFNPSMPVYLSLVDRWMSGNYTPAPAERGGHGEQDVFCSAITTCHKKGKDASTCDEGELGNLTEIDPCYNFRGYWFQKCDISTLVLMHGHHEKKKCSNITKPADLYNLFSATNFSHELFSTGIIPGLQPYIDETLYLRLPNTSNATEPLFSSAAASSS